MITVSADKHLFSLDTGSTSYRIYIDSEGIAETLHYGRLLKTNGHIDAITDKHYSFKGDSIAYSADNPTLNLTNLCLETSTPENGDNRESAVVISYGKRGTQALDFLFKSYEIHGEKPDFDSSLPKSYGKCQTLELTLIDRCFPIELALFYSVFEDSDVIVKRAEIRNKTKDEFTIESAASCQLDLFDSNWKLLSFDGAWARERKTCERAIDWGTVVLDAKNGVGASEHNPLIVLKRPDATQDSGECIGINLLYSGNHRELVQKNEFSKLRVLTGINPAGFGWTLLPGQTFCTPEAVISFSSHGLNRLSRNFSRFVNDNIVRGAYKLRERPVLVNSWEASYFDFDEASLLKLAKSAAKTGVELFVMDDGWFGIRNDDTSGLGDWFADTQKLPEGLLGLSRKIHAMGMKFGLWVEPEMISKESELFEQHPKWRIEIPGRTPKTGRNQYILDLTKAEVRKFIVKTVTDLIAFNEIDYIKWDFNRTFTDLYSVSCNHGEFLHRYYLGLYEVLDTITKQYPDVLFEGCAGGGKRFDLGLLCFFQQMWTSDNTDAIYRTQIQEGTSFGYPLSTMGAHVSASPNHQTRRLSDIETRFNVAAFGVLGYELDMSALSERKTEQVKQQIAFYKKYRALLQYGRFYRINTSEENRTVWAVTDNSKSVIIVLDFYASADVNGSSQLLRIPFADPDTLYLMEARMQLLDKHSAAVVGQDTIEDTSILVPGDQLAYSGVKLLQRFGGTGYNNAVRFIPDMGSRIYIFSKVEQNG